MAKQIVQYPVPLLLRDILRDRTQGELIVKGRNFLKNLFFDKGNLVFARTTVIEERLGEILFKIGKIDRPQFVNILKLVNSKTEKEKLGKVLVQRNILSQRDLFFALLYQLRTIATSIFTLGYGEWHFINKIPSIPEDSRFNIELPGIITEGTNKIGNFSYFKNKFYYQVPKLQPISQNMSEFLSTYEINFYKNLADFANVPCEQVIERMKISEEVFWKKLILFHLLDIVQFREISGDKEINKNVDDILGLYDKLKVGKLDYYELLGQEKTATFNGIKDAYFDYAKKYHPDRLAGAPDPDIKEKANFVFAEINKAYETLSNVDKKREYDNKGYRDDLADDVIHENLTERARMLYRKGKVLYTQKKYWEAVTVLDEAVRHDSRKPAYFLLLGLCQMNVPAQKRMAEKNLQKSIDLEPWNIEALTAMGILFLSENQSNRAEGFFRKALSINPDHTLARKKLQEITNSRTDRKKRSGFSLFGKSKK